MNRFKAILIWLILIMGAFSCKVAERTTGSDAMEKITNETPKILFLNFAAYSSNNHNDYSVKLVNKIVTQGRIKENANHPHNPEPDDMEYFVTGIDSQILQRAFIANPLKQTFEFVSENGFLAKKDVQLDSAMFSLRIQLNPSANRITLERYNGPNVGNTRLLVVELEKDEQK